MPDAITIPRRYSGYIAQVLDTHAAALVRESRLRANSGSAMADRRKHLRLKAQLCNAEAEAIRAQLRS